MHTLLEGKTNSPAPLTISASLLPKSDTSEYHV